MDVRWGKFISTSTGELYVGAGRGIRAPLILATTTSDARRAPLEPSAAESSGQVSEVLRVEKTARMHAVYEREKKLRESADIVVGAGEPRPKHDPKLKYYIESSTSAALRRIFEDGEQPWW